MHSLQLFRVWLEENFGPQSPWVVLTALSFLLVRVSRLKLPKLWALFDDITPDGVLGNALQGVPAVLVGAIGGALMTGGDVKGAATGALSGLFAPVVHHIAKNYTGEVGKTKPPSGEVRSGLVVLVASILCLSCGAGTLASIANGAHAVNEIGRAVAQVAGWCEEKGAPTEKIAKVVEAVQKEDYPTAFVVTNELVADLKKAGVPIPQDKADLLVLAQEAYAAKGIEQGMRALSGRDENGNPK